jgi:ADP-heptose:LPS heptosyltransferase
MKILIVTLDNIGDTLISLGVYNELSKHEDFNLAFWTKEYTRDVIPLAGKNIEHYYCDPFWDRSPNSEKGGFFYYLKILLQIRKANFDAAIILHSNWRKNLSCLLAGIGKRYVLKGAFGTDYIKIESQENHILDSYRKMLQAFLSKDPGELRYSINPSAYGETKKTSNLFTKGQWAIIHPFSGNVIRNLPLNIWANVLNFLESKKLNVLVNVNLKEKELFKKALENECPDKNSAPTFSCDLDLDIKSLAFAISRAKIFIGNDSGPLHLASAIGTPSLGILKETAIKKIAPRGKVLPELVVFKENSSEIKTEEIFSKIEKLLSKKPASIR